MLLIRLTVQHKPSAAIVVNPAHHVHKYKARVHLYIKPSVGSMSLLGHHNIPHVVLANSHTLCCFMQGAAPVSGWAQL